MVPSIRFHPVGDLALTATLAGHDAALFAAALARSLQFGPADGVLSVLPAFETLTIRYDPALAGPRHYERLCHHIRLAADRLDLQANASRRAIEISIFYGGDYGPDLDELAQKVGLSTDEVIALHCEPEYTVAAIGFLPGFAYLTGLDPRLIVPRRATPRTRVCSGSVAVGGHYTGVYPVDSPGGWNLIGRTDAMLFDPRHPVADAWVVGDRIRFRQVYS